MSNINIVRKDLVKLYNVFMGFNKPVDPLFSFFITRNLKCMKDEIETIMELEKKLIPNMQFLNFENERNQLYHQYATKNEDGSIATSNNGQVYFSDENFIEFEPKFNKLKDEYKTVLQERDDAIKAYEELINDTTELDILKISYHKIPKEINFDHEINNILMEHFCKESEEEIKELLL